MLTNFLNNWILDKNIKFDFKKKDYNFPLFNSELSLFSNDFLKDNNDKTISSVDIKEMKIINRVFILLTYDF